jgi:hypothetical protein
MSRKKIDKRNQVDPTDGAKLVWDLRKGEGFRDYLVNRPKIKKECELRYLKTGEKVKIITLSEDWIEVSL